MVWVQGSSRADRPAAVGVRRCVGADSDRCLSSTVLAHRRDRGGDALNHALMLDTEVEGAVGKLLGGGLIAVPAELAFQLTPKGSALVERRHGSQSTQVDSVLSLLDSTDDLDQEFTLAPGAMRRAVMRTRNGCAGAEPPPMKTVGSTSGWVRLSTCSQSPRDTSPRSGATPTWSTACCWSRCARPCRPVLLKTATCPSRVGRGRSTSRLRHPWTNAAPRLLRETSDIRHRKTARTLRIWTR